MLQAHFVRVDRHLVDKVGGLLLFGRLLGLELAGRGGGGGDEEGLVRAGRRMQNEPTAIVCDRHGKVGQIALIVIVMMMMMMMIMLVVMVIVVVKGLILGRG